MRSPSSILIDMKRRGKAISQLIKGFFKPFPLSSQHSHLSCVPFFIIGSGRSGTTLLRAIINQHPTVCIPPEINVVYAIKNYQSYYKFLPWNVAVRLVISDIESRLGAILWEINLANFYQIALGLLPEYRNLAQLIDRLYMYYAQVKKPTATRWGDKSPQTTLDIPWMDKIFPNARHIHIIRDGRDVAASFVDAKLMPDVKTAGNWWLRNVGLAQNFGKKIADTRYLEIFYEDLVHQPVTIIERVCDFLEIDYRLEMLQFWKDVEHLGDPKYFTYHKNLRNPINENSIGKWRKQLSREDQSVLQNMLQHKLLELNYPVD